MDFEWGKEKAEENVIKHGVSFKKATGVFLDNKRLVITDNRFTYGEERFITIGMIDKRIHVVVYTHKTDKIRIISARKANRREQKRYENR